MDMKRVFVMAVLGTIPAVMQAQTPVTGPCASSLVIGAWSFSGNGHQGTLYINSVNSATGDLYGSLSLRNAPVSPIRGFWGGSACQITFYRVNGGTLTSTNPDTTQIHTGYLYPYDRDRPTGTRILAGFTESFALAGGTADRHVFGWHAFR